MQGWLSHEKIITENENSTDNDSSQPFSEAKHLQGS